MTKTIAIIHGTIRNNSFHFPITVNGHRLKSVVLDTGAFELTFDRSTAKALKLPKLQRIAIAGIGGVSSAYRSRCQIKIGHRIYRDVPCVVVPGLTLGPLFGLRFFIDNHLSLTLNTRTQRLRITHT